MYLVLDDAAEVRGADQVTRRGDHLRAAYIQSDKVRSRVLSRPMEEIDNIHERFHEKMIDAMPHQKRAYDSSR